MRTWNSWNMQKRSLLLGIMLMTIVPVTNAEHAPSKKLKGPLWSLVAPGGGSGKVSDGHLRLSVPGAKDGALGQTDWFVRLLQPIEDVDFDISIKIDSPASGKTAEQGLMIATEDQSLVTFEMTRNADGFRLSAHSIAKGGSMTLLDGATSIPDSKSMYLRLERAQAEYREYYSTDGETWTAANGFQNAAVPTSVGVFIGYDRVTPEAVAAVMSVDWFRVQP